MAKPCSARSVDSHFTTFFLVHKFGVGKREPRSVGRESAERIRALLLQLSKNEGIWWKWKECEVATKRASQRPILQTPKHDIDYYILICYCKCSACFFLLFLSLIIFSWNHYWLFNFEIFSSFEFTLDFAFHFHRIFLAFPRRGITAVAEFSMIFPFTSKSSQVLSSFLPPHKYSNCFHLRWICAHHCAAIGRKEMEWKFHPKNKQGKWEMTKVERVESRQWTRGWAVLGLRVLTVWRRGELSSKVDMRSCKYIDEKTKAD